MAVFQEYTIQNVPAATGQSDALPCGILNQGFMVHFDGGVFTAQVQVSYNGTDWFNVGSATAAPARIQVDEPAKFVRVDITAFTSGTPTAQAFGHSAHDRN